MKQKIRYYAGQDIEITWDPRRCIHTAECIHSLPEVFDTERRPWIDPIEEPSVRELNALIK
jgi:uncharacterized Fe-S cluster protein YjdI